MSAIERCRTAALGGHVARCENEKCAHIIIAYNSCRNRHCPKCQGAAAREWLAAREADLLPVPYFHVVFTLPAPIARHRLPEQGRDLRLLFKASAETMLTIAADPQAPWSPHRHHLGAAHLGLGNDPSSARAHDRAGRRPLRWRQPLDLVQAELPAARAGSLKPVSPLDAGEAFGRTPSRRAAVLRLHAHLADAKAFAAFLAPLGKKRWFVYAKRPFAGPEGRARLSVALHPPRRHLEPPPVASTTAASRSRSKTTGSKAPAATRR